MGIQLLIRDGDPNWYLSPDIWVVPGNDPNGPLGSPIAGIPAYLWTHVSNTGDTDASNVRVDFYWANPALQVLRSNSTMVGSAFVDISAGGSQDVLCLIPWVPQIVNGGHECLVVVASHPGDPLPNPPPNDFDPPTYRQVAQKNLTVLTTRMHALSHAITITGWHRSDKEITVMAEIGKPLDKFTLRSLGIEHLRPSKNDSITVGLDRKQRCIQDNEQLGSSKLKLSIPRGTCAAVYVTIRAKNLAKDEYQFINITERSADRILGGCGLIIVSESGEKQ